MIRGSITLREATNVVLDFLLKANDGYIASVLQIARKITADLLLSNCYDNLFGSSNTIEHNRIYLDCPGH